MTSHTDLFIGATDNIAVLDYDDSMYAADAFAGTESDALLNGADDRSIEVDDGFDGMGDDADVITVSDHSDMTFDLGEETFENDDDADLLAGSADDLLFLD